MKAFVTDILRVTLAIALVVGIHDQAIAQETPSTSSSDSAPTNATAPPNADWTGFYVGAHGGMFGGSSAWSTTPPSVPSSSGSLNLFNTPDLLDGSGSQFGGFGVGYSRQLCSRLVIGGETDVSFAAEPSVGASPFNDTIEAFGTTRGRIGYGAKNRLYYVTGGLAWTHDQFQLADIVQALSGRIGWALGAGIDVRVAPSWTARAEYLSSRFGTTTVAFPLGARTVADLSMQQVRVGLNYELAKGSDPDGAPLGIAALDLPNLSVHGQTTFLSQYAPPFHAPYSGTNSLASNAGRQTWDATLYVGRRLWKGAELWFNPEIDQGFGLSDTLGVAGFPSGEAYKVGFAHPYVRLPRAFIRQTMNLGGEAENVEPGLNQFAGSQTANRLVVTVGRFSVSDLFDTITYAHDPRNDFMNWALVDAGTFDYAADAWGFTYGAALEWYRRHWTVRAGVFDLSIVPNSIELTSNFSQYQVVYEIEHRHEWMGHPGKIALVGFLSRGRMGRFDNAVALAQQTGTVPSTADVREYAGRPGVNLNAEHQLKPSLALFGRVGWANGSIEPYEFTDVDRTLSAGMSLDGKRWGRPDDTFGLATVVNDITSAHVAYLNAGGLGILVGDGQLPHPGLEQILETYYRLRFRSWEVTADYQFVVNPAYNRDRGPVSVVSLRLRTQF
jgi:high affinity Mn2+ porin